MCCYLRLCLFAALLQGQIFATYWPSDGSMTFGALTQVQGSLWLLFWHCV